MAFAVVVVIVAAAVVMGVAEVVVVVLVAVVVVVVVVAVAVVVVAVDVAVVAVVVVAVVVVPVVVVVVVVLVVVVVVRVVVVVVVCGPQYNSALAGNGPPCLVPAASTHEQFQTAGFPNSRVALLIVACWGQTSGLSDQSSVARCVSALNEVRQTLVIRLLCSCRSVRDVRSSSSPCATEVRLLAYNESRCRADRPANVCG